MSGIDEAIERCELGILLRLLALIALYGLNGIGENFHGRNLLSLRKTLQHLPWIRLMLQTKPGNSIADDIHAGVHGIDVMYVSRRPEALGDGCVAWPNAIVDVFGADPLGPHAGLATEDAFGFLWREIR